MTLDGVADHIGGALLTLRPLGHVTLLCFTLSIWDARAGRDRPDFKLRHYLVCAGIGFQ